MSKNECRRELRARLARLSPEEKRAKSAVVAGRLARTPWWRDARLVLAYRAMKEELDTDPLIRAALSAGKDVAVPRITGDDLVFHRIRGLEEGFIPGVWGIPEPDPALPSIGVEEAGARPVLVVTPGLGFDHLLHRLGRGRGYYDRWLGRLRAAGGDRVRAVGVCFAEQLLERVPVDDHDLSVDGIVTDGEEVPPDIREIAD